MYSSSSICCVGGKDGGGDNIDGADRRLSDADQRALYIQQMEDMQAEREALFGFTPHDHDAWGNNAAEHKHDADFMEMIDQARQQQQKEEEEENESIVS
ncbi:MAG: hypothetical protein V2I33_21005, partial [Kangiellaceae bacterium]|nr:hypothetical protein [Kangiellaceae bacterium]